ncbi:unnamed protein product [Ectocarpus fasciculatus]
MAGSEASALIGVMTVMALLHVFSSPARNDTGTVADSFKEPHAATNIGSTKRRCVRLCVRVLFVLVMFGTYVGLESMIRWISSASTAKPKRNDHRYSEGYIERINEIHRASAKGQRQRQRTREAETESKTAPGSKRNRIGEAAGGGEESGEATEEKYKKEAEAYGRLGKSEEEKERFIKDMKEIDELGRRNMEKERRQAAEVSRRLEKKRREAGF